MEKSSKRKRTEEIPAQNDASRIEGNINDYDESMVKDIKIKIEVLEQNIQEKNQKIKEIERELRTAEQNKDKQRIKSLEIRLHDCMTDLHDCMTDLHDCKEALKTNKQILLKHIERNHLLAATQSSSG